MGTRRKGRPVEWKISVPVDLAVAFERLIMDQTKGKPIYGARSFIITELIRKHLDELRKETPCPTPQSQPLKPLMPQG